jgi:glycosidase
MSSASPQPTVYELNAPIFLNEIAARTGERVTFANVPDSEWDRVTALKPDMVWFMGVWKRSPIAREMAFKEPWLQQALPGVEQKDILGSAYSIAEYAVDDQLGGNDALAIARAKLQERGVGLMLDYVPNHVGLDHHWVTEHPEYFLAGSENELAADRTLFVQTAGGIFARGKDPNFAPWSDVLQLNAYAPGLRAAVKDTLLTIAGMCDAVRCDMAMLMMNGIFKKTWGPRVGAAPETEYWPLIIQAVKEQHPQFLFLAEVYWDKEGELLEQGFDLCYDKKLYDFLLEGAVHDIKRHLTQTAPFADKLMRFLENHDEERAAKELPFAQHQAAAVIMATVPGAHLYHEGQFEGRKVRVPVHLGRRQDEAANSEITALYNKLFAFIQESGVPKGDWQLQPVGSSFLGWESRSILAWSWQTASHHYFICVNYSSRTAKGHAAYLDKKSVQKRYDLSGIDPNVTPLRNSQFTLGPWQSVVFELN